jgi:WYL domain
VDNEGGKLRWGAEQRLEFIEFQAFWEGGVRRGDITSRFGVSVPQASNDLTLYQKLAPQNLRYDSSEKRYVPTLEFAPRFLKPNAERYLVQLQAIANRVITLADTWIANAPDAGVMPVPYRRIDPTIFKRFVEVIRASRSIEIHYQSMNVKRPDAIWRRITPHAFGTDGLRWHVRGFCHLENKFKDFILSRCRELRAEGDAGASASDDRKWLTDFDVHLIPNPELSESQQETIAMDYNMRDGRAVVPIRYAMLYYFEKRLRLDVDSKKDRPAEKPVVVANWKEFIEARDAAMA